MLHFLQCKQGHKVVGRVDSLDLLQKQKHYSPVCLGRCQTCPSATTRIPRSDFLTFSEVNHLTPVDPSSKRYRMVASARFLPHTTGSYGVDFSPYWVVSHCHLLRVSKVCSSPKMNAVMEAAAIAFFLRPEVVMPDSSRL